MKTITHRVITSKSSVNTGWLIIPTIIIDWIDWNVHKVFSIELAWLIFQIGIYVYIDDFNSQEEK